MRIHRGFPLLAGVCTVGALITSPATPASAAPSLVTSKSGTVAATPSVNVRQAPCVASGCAIQGTLAYGTRVTISCWLSGDQVTGWGGTSTAWDLIVDPLVNGQAGWAADVWINTGGDIRSQLKPCP